MGLIDDRLLSIMTLLPALGAVLLWLPKRGARKATRTIALVASGASLLLALRMLMLFQPQRAALQLVERVEWIPTLRADYFVGVDGLSVLAVVLATLIVPLSLLTLTGAGRGTLALTLLLETGLLGVFTAQSFLHWFIYWETVLIPAFFLVRSAGTDGARKAALSFFLYTLVGSVAMLLAFQAIYFATGELDFRDLARLGQSGALERSLQGLAAGVGLDWTGAACASLACCGILLACAVKTPLWPFHTWLPDTYANAPTATTMLLTAGMSKMGVYAVLRLALPLFPGAMAELQPLLIMLALVTVIAGAFAALWQTDLKRMMAYSSVNHVGYCLLGAFAAAGAGAGLVDDRAAALDGVVLQMFVHGITAAAMFHLLARLEQRTGRLGLNDFGGLRRVAPLFCGAFGLVTFASLGLPGLAGFVAELLILRGTLALVPWAAALAFIGIVVTAVFLLATIQRVWWGPLDERWRDVRDLSARELAVIGVFLVLIVLVGVVPGVFVETADATVQMLSRALDGGGGAR